MAQTSQSSSLKKILIFGLPVIAIVLLYPQGEPVKTGHKPLPGSGTASKSKKKTDIYTAEDTKVKRGDFEVINASVKNNFVPLVTKGNGKMSEMDIPVVFTQGEPGWRYTGNMTVDGVANALFENANTGDGAFIRPGEHWKGLRLVTVRQDSIVIEGPNGESKTINFDETTSVSNAAALAPLPVAAPANQGNNNANPANTQPGGRRPRGNNQFAQDDGSINGPIGAAYNADPSGQTQNQNFNNGNGNRRNRNRRNNENSFN